MLIPRKDNRAVHVECGMGEGTSTIIERALLSRPGGIPLDVYVPIIHILCFLYYYYTVVGRRVVEICIRYARA